jgi:hypothetical protein
MVLGKGSKRFQQKSGLGGRIVLPKRKLQFLDKAAEPDRVLLVLGRRRWVGWYSDKHGACWTNANSASDSSLSKAAFCVITGLLFRGSVTSQTIFL